MKNFTLKKPLRLLKKLKSEKVRRRSKGEHFVGDRLDNGDYIAKICYTHEESRKYIRKLLGL